MSMIDAVTVRPILPNELETVAELRTLCFGGDADATVTRLQNDPRYDTTHMIAAEYENQIIGTATIFPAKMWLSGVPMNIGAVAGVCVQPEHRRNGVAAKLMAFAITQMALQGTAMSVLFPFSHKYYNKHGYGTMGDLHAYTIKPENLLPYEEKQHVRPFQPDDLPMMRVMYKGQMTWHNGWFTRSNNWWDMIIQQWPDIMVFEQDDMIEGYYTYQLTENDSGETVLTIEELFAAEGAAYRGLIGYLATQTDASQISYLAPPDTPLRHALREPREEGGQNRGWLFDDMAHITPGPMARIINLSAALTTRFYARHMSGERILKVTDPLISANEEEICFRVVDGRPEVTPPHGRSPQIETDIQTMSQILTGYLKSVDALRLGRLKASEDDCSWLDQILADTPVYIQRSDWF